MILVNGTPTGTTDLWRIESPGTETTSFHKIQKHEYAHQSPRSDEYESGGLVGILTTLDLVRMIDEEPIKLRHYLEG